MRNPKAPAGTLRMVAPANAMGNQMELRVEASVIHIMHTAPGQRGGRALRIGSPEMAPPLSLTAGIKLIIGNA